MPSLSGRADRTAWPFIEAAGIPRLVSAVSLIGLTLCLAAPAHAEGALEACWARSENRIELGQCLGDLKARSDADMEAVYAAALGQMAELDRVTGRPGAQRALERAQSAFVLYRDLECHARELQAASGTGAGDFFQSCWIDLTRERSAILAQAAGPAAEDDLTGSWLAEDIEGRGVIDMLQSTITFEADGQVAGNAGCNRFFGQAEIDGDKLAFGPFGTTRKSCTPAVNDQEQRFLAALAKAAGYSFDKGLLFIADAKGKMLLRLSRME